MKRLLRWDLPALLFTALAFAITGCGKQRAADRHAHGASDESKESHVHADAHGHEGEHEEEAGANFKEGRGIQLGEEAAPQIGLQTADVATRKLTIRFTTNARVYETAHAHSPKDAERAHHDSHASAMVSAHQAEFLAAGQPVEIDGGDGATIEGRLARLDAETTKAIGQVEAIIDMPDPEHRFEFGSFVKATFNGGEREVLAIPQSALLESASGTFVYVQNSDRYLRAPVKVGAVGDGMAEITDGLFEGDIVVTQGAVDLWLIELRFTKGGGHSH